MEFRLKIFLVLLLVSPTTEVFAASALFGNASCSEIRAAIANAENQLRQWEAYKAKGAPGSAGMDLGDLRSKIGAGKAEYESLCSGRGNRQYAPLSPPQGAGPAPPGPQFSRDNPFAPGYQQGGTGGPGDGPGQQGGQTFSRDNPFAPGYQPGGTGQQGSAPGQQGGQPSGPDNPLASGGQQGGAPVNEPKDPTVNYHGQACFYFTKPGVRADGGGINAYADGANVCYGGRFYECEQRRWVLRGSCSAFDPKGTRRAEDIEKSTFDINIYQKE